MPPIQWEIDAYAKRIVAGTKLSPNSLHLFADLQATNDVEREENELVRTAATRLCEHLWFAKVNSLTAALAKPKS